MSGRNPIFANRPSTLVEVLRGRAQLQPDRLAYTFLADGETEDSSLTYAALDRRARAIAEALRQMGPAGERALLVYPSGLDYMAAFFGCLYAGFVAVPVYPPDPSRLQRTLPRFRAIVEDAQPLVALTTSPIIDMARHLSSQDPALDSLQWLATDQGLEALADDWQEIPANPDNLAFLQYTSGSTASPKGVMVSHGNLMYNFAMLGRAVEHPQDALFVSWLPLYHDMGLIGVALQAVYVGAPCVLMPPEAFIKKPSRWLQAVTRYKATISGGPNFAYELCVRKIAPEGRAELDLHSWITAFNGAEPVRHRTLESFARAFEPHGFRREAFFPCYGLAEATLFVTGGVKGDPPIYQSIDPASLEQGVVIPGEKEAGHSLVGCGRSWLDQDLLIVDPDTGTECPPGRVGEIWVSGPHIAGGYWGRPDESDETFKARLQDSGKGPYLRTGDLGYLHGRELFITGRIKDLIIIRGRNLYPQDIELTVEQCHAGLRPGCGAAFSIEVAAEERLVVVQEVRNTEQAQNTDEILSAIRQAIAEQHEVQVLAIALIEPRTIHKTSSGKIQRRATQAAFLKGELDLVAEWVQPAATEKGTPDLPGTPEIRTKAPPAVLDLQRWLVAQVADRLAIAPEQIDITSPLAQFGLDSREAVSIAGELETLLEQSLPATLLYEYPTIQALAQHLGTASEPLTASQDQTLLGRATSEPVAVVGIGLRFPGANGPGEFWRLLRKGEDVISRVPANRWDLEDLYDPDPATPGKIHAPWGGFIEDIDHFDAGFFNISPREAARMDPQQRLLLEVACEALQDAGIPVDGLAGSKTGVFIGISAMEYAQLQLGDPALIDAYAGTGNALSIAANRLSYFLDAHGPSMAVDTACSSSLLAVHLAKESLWRGEASLALAGGVNLLLSPAISVAFTKAGLMAADGRCKTFDARADGYVRGEGAGIVVLKLLSQAQADGDRIYAVIRGSAVVHDGRSNGLMAPNPQAQQAVLREAYRQAGVTPGRVHYVETHGTGTLLGDPIEARSLGAVLAEGRSPGQQAHIGSVKTNIGHLEAAAGVAGLIKVALALKNREIPPSLHFIEPNPHIPFEDLDLHVPTAPFPWPDSGPPLAGVSSFGFGGTNVHAVLEAAPEEVMDQELPADSDNRYYLLPISAKDPQALNALAGRYQDFLLTSTRENLAEIGYAAGVRRSHHSHRLAVLGRDITELNERLDAYLQGEVEKGVSSGSGAQGHIPQVVFVFSGHGSQWPGMGKSLYAREPVFKGVVDRCERVFLRLGGWSLVAMLAGAEDAEQWEKIDRLQPAIFAIQVGVAALLKSWGVVPDAVVGHSMGEVAAAYAAGALTLEDAARVIFERSRQMIPVSGHGKTMMVGLPLDLAQEFIQDYGESVSVAVINGPDSTVISGSPSALAAIAKELTNQDIFFRYVKTEVAFHSPQMEPFAVALTQTLEGLQTHPGSVPIYSTVTAERIAGPDLSAAYWGRNLRQTVNFFGAVRKLLEDGFATFVEISPHPILSSAIRQALSHHGTRGNVISTMQRDELEQENLLNALAALYTLGHPVDFASLYPRDFPYASLPSYPWQHKHHWLEPNGRFSLGVDFPHGRRQDQLASVAEIPHDWLYQVQWVPTKRGESVSPDSTREKRVLLFSDDHGYGDALASRLAAGGHHCIVVHRGGEFQQSGDHFQVRPESPEDFVHLIHACLFDGAPGLDAIVHLWSLDAPQAPDLGLDDLENGQLLGCGSVLHLVQALDQCESVGRPRLWLLTQGAQPVGDMVQGLAFTQAPLWGLGRALAEEHFAWWGGLIDLSPQDLPAEAAGFMAEEILDPDGEDQLAFRSDRRYAARLQRMDLPGQPARPLRWRADGTYLITGGLGGLGLALAGWLVQQGVRRLILLGRTGLPPRAEWGRVGENDPLFEKVKGVLELEAMGASVHLAALDVADEAQLVPFLDRFQEENWPPICGVFHLAGIVRGQLLHELSLASLQEVLRPKIQGAWLLHTHLAGQDLDCFVLFSSAAAILNFPYHSSYAAANAFLDALAHHRRAHGQPALSINWGAWAETGMASRFQEQARRSLVPVGMGEFSPAQGLAILDYLMGDDAIQTGVFPMDWRTLLESYPAAAQSPILKNLVGSEPDFQPRDVYQTQEPTFARNILGLAPEDRRKHIERLLRTRVGQVLHMDSNAVPAERNLVELGLDSLMAMELIRRIDADLQLLVFPREIFERPTIQALAGYLTQEVESHHGSLGGQTNIPVRVVPAAEALEALKQKSVSEDLPQLESRIPPVAFLLSAPRSGSTLLRVMLAGHPGLFSPPELHLLPYSSMKARQESLRGSYLVEGLQRAIMQLKGIGVEESRDLVDSWLEQDYPIHDAYRQLQTMAGGRLLIDKSPSYAASLETLHRAERMVDRPKYIHLVRHPVAVIESAARMRLDKLLGVSNVDPFDFGEQIWTTMNRNILDFASGVDEDRYFLLHYETLVRQPAVVLRQLCDFLEIPFDEAMLTPYEGERMTDGVYSASMSIGDPNFLMHDSIDPTLADSWRAISLPRSLEASTRQLAAQLDYELPPDQEFQATGPDMPALVPIQLQGEGDPIFLVHPGSGLVYFFYQLGYLLGQDVPFYALQDPSLGGDREPHENIEAYAREYIEAIRMVQPQGPYRIGGWSFGGHVAFEMACQLKESGHEVGLLALLDTEAPLAGRPLTLKQRLQYLKNRTVEFAAFLLDVSPYVRDGFYLLVVRDKLREDHPGLQMSRREYIQWAWADALHRRLARRAGMGEIISREASFLRMRIPTIRRVLYVLSRHMGVVSRYQPKIYRGKLTLLRAKEQVRRQFFPDHHLGWRDLVEGEIDVRPISGNHVTMFKQPYVEEVASTILACINEEESE